MRGKWKVEKGMRGKWKVGNGAGQKKGGVVVHLADTPHEELLNRKQNSYTPCTLQSRVGGLYQLAESPSAGFQGVLKTSLDPGLGPGPGPCPGPGKSMALV